MELLQTAISPTAVRTNSSYSSTNNLLDVGIEVSGTQTIGSMSFSSCMYGIHVLPSASATITNVEGWGFDKVNSAIIYAEGTANVRHLNINSSLMKNQIANATFHDSSFGVTLLGGGSVQDVDFWNIQGGSALTLQGYQDYTVDSVNFTSCSAPTGGAMTISTVRSVTVSNTQFDSNSAASDAGALLITTNDQGQIVNVTDCTFTNNMAGGNGGSIGVINAPCKNFYYILFL